MVKEMKLRSNFFCAIVLVGFLLALQVNGQVTKSPQAAPMPKVEATPKLSPPIMVEKATTETGKFVLLKSDGTWEYDTTPRPAPIGTPTQIPVEAKGILRFKAAVITRGGNVIPAARGDFWLLDRDLREILADKVSEKLKSGSLLDRSTAYMLSQDHELIEPHKIIKTASDFEGNGTFADVPPKTYWVYFFGSVGVNHVLWSLKVDVKPGENYVFLDQNNALETFSR